jgi:hypothetical protein
MNADRPRQATVSYFGLCGLLLIVIFSENVKEKGLNVKKIPRRFRSPGTRHGETSYHAEDICG